MGKWEKDIYVPAQPTAKSVAEEALRLRIAEVGNTRPVIRQEASTRMPRPLPRGAKSITCGKCGTTIRNGEWWRYRRSLSRYDVTHTSCP